MFQEFRQHYPQGSLITEFVRVDREKYIVRALIQLDGITLLTSLASANSVEEAEDKARERVLTLFDISGSVAREKNAAATNNQSKNNITPVEIESQATREKILPAMATNDLNAASKTPVESIEYNPTTVALSSREIIEPQEELLLSTEDNPPHPQPSEVESNGKQIDLFDAPPNVRTQAVEKEAEPKTGKVAVSTLEPPTSETIDPMDLIVKTDIEMQRLGWTKEQGRDFLLQRYGKRSRHVLNERELREFLDYLNSQV
jgi:hypothetical protein